MTLTKQLEEKEAEAEKKAKEADELAAKLAESERLRKESEDRARRAGDAVRKAKETAATEKEEAVKAALKDAVTKAEAEKVEAIEAALKAEAEKSPKPEPADGKKPPAKLAVAKDPAWVPLVSGIAIAILVIAPTFWWFGFHKRAESTKPVPMSLTEELKDLKAKLEKAKEDDAARREISATKAELAKFGVVSEEKPPEEEPTASAGPSAQTEEFKRFMEGMTSFTEYMRHVMSRPGGPSAGEPAAAEPVALETEQDTTEETTSEDKASPARPKPSARLVLEVNDGANAYIGGPVVLGPKAVIPADDKVARDLYVLEERLSKKEAELYDLYKREGLTHQVMEMRKEVRKMREEVRDMKFSKASEQENNPIQPLPLQNP